MNSSIVILYALPAIVVLVVAILAVRIEKFGHEHRGWPALTTRQQVWALAQAFIAALIYRVLWDHPGLWGLVPTLILIFLFKMTSQERLSRKRPADR